MLPANSTAETNILNQFSFDDCDPFEARALIMAVHDKKAQFVAAEQTIYVVNASLGDERLITELTDADGNYMDFGSFKPGNGFMSKDSSILTAVWWHHWFKKLTPRKEKSRY